MRDSLIQGKKLPESWGEFQLLKEEGRLKFVSCVLGCRLDFSQANVRTPTAWRETQISGSCENCWDALFANER